MSNGKEIDLEPREIVQRYLDTAFGADQLVANVEHEQRTHHFRAAFPDLEVETLALLAEGDRVAAHFVARGTHHGLFNGVPPTGNEWEARCTAIYRVEEDRIVEAWVTWDLLALMEQLDAIERVQTISA